MSTEQNRKAGTGKVKTSRKSKTGAKKSIRTGAGKHKTVVAPKRASAPKRAPKRAAATATQKRTKAKAAAGPVGSASQFMAYAYAMEVEAAERYAEFADSMEVHNNREVAELFRKLSRIEQRHADQILEQMGWKQSPVTSVDVRWEGAEGPETGDPTELHYLMQPYHALQIALHNEKRARDFFAHLAIITKDAGVRKRAMEMEQDEAEHVHLIEEWIARTPVPDSNWEADLDPPMLSD